MISTSHRVRADAFTTPWCVDRRRELDLPDRTHRKDWEFAVIAQVALERVGPRGHVLGFGVGLEPLPSWFARQGATVLATDDPAFREDWIGQHAEARGDLFRPRVCLREDFDRHVAFTPLDMTQLPETLRQGDFDLTWSTSTFEHLGSIEAGLTFFCRQMACLRPGGIAVHTTELNPHPGPTLEAHNIVLYQATHLRELADRLAAQGDWLFPLDLTPGTTPADAHVDTPPYGDPHLTAAVCDGQWQTTSVVLIAQRGA